MLAHAAGGLALLVLTFLAPQPPLTGTATYYARGVFQQVWTETRQYQLAPCPDCIGYVALMKPEHLGRRVWLSNGRETLGPFHVIDCAQGAHLAGRLARGDVAELDTWLAERWGALRWNGARWIGYGRVRVTVYFTSPRVVPETPLCRGRPHCE